MNDSDLQKAAFLLDDVIEADLLARLKNGSFTGVDEMLAYSLRGRRIGRQYGELIPGRKEESSELSAETLRGLLTSGRA